MSKKVNEEKIVARGKMFILTSHYFYKTWDVCKVSISATSFIIYKEEDDSIVDQIELSNANVKLLSSEE